MLIDWIHWLASTSREHLLWCLLPLLLTDMPRHTLESIAVLLSDLCFARWRTNTNPTRKRGTLRASARSRTDASGNCSRRPTEEETSLPSVCVIIAGYNEATTVTRTLQTTWGTYPNLEILVVDDGSNDGMSQVVAAFAREHANVHLLQRPRRGGKSSALNYALAQTDAEIIVCIDADSELAANAILEIVRPFQDSNVGAVSGNVRIRNEFENVLTTLQSLEYLQAISVSRRFSSFGRFLGIVSGAFGAYRRDALLRTGGWDVGPGEDSDLTLTLRKSGYDVVFVPDADCLTQATNSWRQLMRQRRRWDWAIVTFCLRKHVDMGNPLSSSFRFGNLLWLLDRWIFNIVLTYVMWGYALWLTFNANESTGYVLYLYYVVYCLMNVVQLGVITYFSRDFVRALMLGAVIPLSPFYYLLLRFVSLIAITEEIISRRSYRDDFVPRHVREATWHW